MATPKWQIPPQAPGNPGGRGSARGPGAQPCWQDTGAPQGFIRRMTVGHQGAESRSVLHCSHLFLTLESLGTLRAQGAGNCSADIREGSSRLAPPPSALALLTLHSWSCCCFCLSAKCCVAWGKHGTAHCEPNPGNKPPETAVIPQPLMVPQIPESPQTLCLGRLLGATWMRAPLHP